MFGKKNYFIHTLKGWISALSVSIVLSCTSLPAQASSIALHSDTAQAYGSVAKGKKKKKSEAKKKKVKAIKKAKKKSGKKTKKKTAKTAKTEKGRVTLCAGDIAVNQKKYIKNYEKDKSEYIYRALMSYEDDIDVSSLGYHLDMSDPQASLDDGDLRRTYNLMLLEHPDLIHVSKSINVSANTETGLVTHIRPVYTVPQSRYHKALKATYAAADRIAAKARKKKGIKTRIRYVDSAIRKKVSYKMTDTGISAYGALVRGKAFCMGYARAFSLCMSRLKIPCAYELTEAHVWNRVKVSGKWYVVDTTYNDADDIQLSNLLSEKHTEPEGIVVN